MKKTMVKALVVGLLFVVVYYAFQIIRGMYLTANYVPDIINAYESVDVVQQKVKFGSISNPIWAAIEIAGLMLLGFIVVYTGKLLKRNK